ncbi:hypothetical protein [Gordonia sp. NPDC003585]|uniref:hypothetical protein n=1 Tax=Gordonia sp. NPDC003585 TaxID=3154275 RepID=UPI0033A81E86
MVTPKVSRPPLVDDMLRFALHWLPYGGGSAGDILVEFGISECEFFRRVLRVVRESEPPPACSVATWRQLGLLCVARIGREHD